MNTTSNVIDIKQTHDEILKGLKAIMRQGDVVELRIMTGNKRKGTISGYFNDINKLTDVATGYSGKFPGIYITINPVIPDLLARANNRVEEWAKHTSKAEDVKQRLYLPLDIDPKRPSGISATDAQHNAALVKAIEIQMDLKEKFGLPDPIRGDSGNGAHLVYHIDLPNDKESKEIVELAQKGIAGLYNRPDDIIEVQCFSDANRIWKLYGTMACKGDPTPERPHRQSRVLEVPIERKPLTLEQLKKLAELAPKDNNQLLTRTKASTNGKPSEYHKIFDVEGYMEKYAIGVHHLKNDGSWKTYVLDSCVFNPEHSGNLEACIQQEQNSGILVYKCHHNSCSDKHWADVRNKFEPERMVSQEIAKEKEKRRKKKRIGDDESSAIDILEDDEELVPILQLLESIERVDMIKPRIVGTSHVYTCVFHIDGIELIIPSNRMLGSEMFARRYFEEFQSLPTVRLADNWSLFILALGEQNKYHVIQEEKEDDITFDAEAFLAEVRRLYTTSDKVIFQKNKTKLYVADGRVYLAADQVKKIKDNLRLKISHKNLTTMIKEYYITRSTLKCGEGSKYSVWCWIFTDKVLSDEAIDLTKVINRGA